MVWCSVGWDRRCRERLPLSLGACSGTGRIALSDEGSVAKAYGSLYGEPWVIYLG